MKLFSHLLSTLPVLLLLSSRLRYNLLTTVWIDHSTIILCFSLLVFLATLYATTRPRPVYLVDLACYKPSDKHKATHQKVMTQFALGGSFTPESETFQRRIIEKSGIGQETYLPSSLLSQPLDTCLSTAREEAMEVIFGAVDELVGKTGVRMEEIGLVVVNCSTYNPTPSLAGMIVSKYGMREDVVGYNLSGMGCSSGLIAMDLVKRLLQVHPDTYALLVSTENITLNGYFGNNRSMLVTNSLFRMGGAAILLSNRSADRRHAKYQLLHTIRTHKGADDQAYSCVNQQEDDEGRSGIALSKDLMRVAGEALKANITTLGPLVLPITEQLQFLKTLILRKLFKVSVKPYIPDFKLAFEHFCIHAGGRAVLDELERHLQLTSWHMEPSRMTLYRFGNTSSSSLWYELTYCEAKGRIKRGDRVWQVAFGSGFKCNSAVWRVLRTVDPAAEKKNPWMEEIERFPVVVPELQRNVM